MERIDINKGIKLAIIVGILLISFSIFYYFVIFIPKIQKEISKEKIQQQAFEEYRTQTVAEIRKSCHNEALADAKKVYKSLAEENSYFLKGDYYLKANYESYYESCLRNNGLAD